MATCKDCIHERVCYALIKSGLPYIDNEIPAEAFCMTFADKSRYIELPCKVGDTVYYITGIGHNLVKPARVKEIIIDKNGIKDLYVQGDGHNFENSFDIFFLTREQAETALKERKQE